MFRVRSASAPGPASAPQAHKAPSTRRIRSSHRLPTCPSPHGRLARDSSGKPSPARHHARPLVAAWPANRFWDAGGTPSGSQWITRKRLGEALTRPDTPSNSLNRKARGCSNAATPGLRTTHQAAPNGVVDGIWASIPKKDSTIPPHFATFLVRFGSLRLDI